MIDTIDKKFVKEYSNHSKFISSDSYQHGQKFDQDINEYHKLAMKALDTITKLNYSESEIEKCFQDMKHFSDSTFK